MIVAYDRRNSRLRRAGRLGVYPNGNGSVPPIPSTCLSIGSREAKATEPNDPNAMVLGDGDGRRSAFGAGRAAQGSRSTRLHVLQPIRKAARVTSWRRNPRAALGFHWKSLRRQGSHQRHGAAGFARGGGCLFPQPAARQAGSAPGHPTSPVRSMRGRTLEASHCRARCALSRPKNVPRPPHWSGLSARPGGVRVLA